MRIFLSPENDRDITLVELKELAREITMDTKSLSEPAHVFVGSTEEFGAGLSWDEVLQVILPLLPTAEVFRDATIGIALDRTVSWMRKRFRKHPHERDRTRVIEVYNENGELLRIYRIIDEDAAPEIRDAPEEE